MSYRLQDGNLHTYFEHLRTTMFAIGDSSCIQFQGADGDLPISSNSSSKGLRLPINHLNDPSLTRFSSRFLVLFAIAISPYGLTVNTIKLPVTTREFNYTRLNHSLEQVLIKAFSYICCFSWSHSKDQHHLTTVYRQLKYYILLTVHPVLCLLITLITDFSIQY